MRRRLGILFMVLGTVLVLGAIGLVFYNTQEDQAAREFSNSVMPEIREQILQVQETVCTETPVQTPENTPAEYLSSEDLTMTEKIVDGYGYIGYLQIPDLELELPVMSQWDSGRLQMSPCRYTGSTRGENLVIMAHNYRSHFGRLSQLSVGTQVQFVDMDGKRWDYQVVAIDVLAAEAVEEMTAGVYDLALFTCSTNRTHRVTVYCDLV